MQWPWARRRRNRIIFRSLSRASRLAIFAAIFFTFGSVGFIDDIWTVRQLSPWPYVWASVLFTGLMAVAYAYSFTISRKLLFLAVPFHFLVPTYVLPALRQHLTAAGAAAATYSDRLVSLRLHADGIGCIVFVTLGYALFIRFITGEGSRHLRLRTEVALAERIHSTLVPQVAIHAPRYEVFGRSEPSSAVGGDLLDVVERDGALVACIADVSGHGVAAGAFMGMVKSAFRMRMLAAGGLDALLDDLNAVIGQIRNPETFVTFAGVCLDDTNVAELALAGHLPILHLHRASGAFEAIANTHPPLGVVPGQRHVSRRVTFEPGDLFVLLTDGLTEVSNARREQFGTQGVEAVLQRCANDPPAGIYADVLAAVRAHGAQTDDQTLLLIRIR